MKADSTSDTNDLNKKVLKEIAKRDFCAWTGIPVQLLYSDFCNYFPAVSDNYGVGRLGRHNIEAYYRMHDIEGYRLASQVWFIENELQLIELNFPILKHPTLDIDACIGSPAAKLDYHLDIALIKKGAWIYPKRGISLLMDSPGVELMKVYLFHPCNFEHYLDAIHFDEEMEEFPE